MHSKAPKLCHWTHFYCFGAVHVAQVMAAFTEFVWEALPNCTPRQLAVIAGAYAQVWTVQCVVTV